MKKCKKNIKKIIFIFLLTTVNVFSYGQLSNKQYTTYSVANGLADNNMKAILQDKYGYIWTATENGLSRFDGLTFSSFPFSKNNTPLPGDDITDIQLRDSSSLLVVTTQGLSIINLNTLTNTNIIIPNGSIKYSYKVNYLRQLLINSTNTDFFLTTKSGFYHFNKNNQLVFRYDDYLPTAPDAPMAFGIYTYWLNDETIITAGQKGIYEYNCIKKSIKKIDNKNSNFLLTKYLTHFKINDYHILQPSKGKFILLNYKSDSLLYVDELKKIATFSKIPILPINSLFTWRSKLFKVSDTVFIITGKFKGLYNLKINPANGNLQLDTNVLFYNKKCNVIFIDKNKKYWIGFDDELKAEKTSKINLSLKPAVIPFLAQSKRADVLQLAVTNKHIYTANMISGGLHQFNKITLEYQKTIPFKFPPFGNKSLLAVEKWNNDTLLCGTDAGLFLYSENKQRSQFVQIDGWNSQYNWVSNIFLDSKKNMWIASNFDSGCYVWKPNTKLPQWFALDNKTAESLKHVFHFAEDKKGNIWLAGKGAARYNTAENKIDICITSFTKDPNSITAVEAIACDEIGGVWMAYSTKGLFFYNTATKKNELYTTLNGLPNNIIQDVKYKDNYIWITCKNGIAKINCSTKIITAVCSLKDVNFMPFTSSNLVFDETTSSFFTGVGEDVIKFEAENKSYKNTAPKLLVENIEFKNDSIQWYPSNKLTVSWKDRNLILTFNAINFENALYQKYAYKIVNSKNKDWVELGDQHKIVFNELGIGKTVIELKVFSPQYLFDENSIQFTINVVPPFWRTNWFYLTCLFTFFTTFYGIVKYQLKQQQKITTIKENISKDLHDEVGATLSGIAMYSHLVKINIEKKEENKAIQSLAIIQKSSAEMVDKLNDIVWLLKPKQINLLEVIQKINEYAEEMATAKQFTLSINKVDIVSSTKCTIELQKNIYLICKEAINNAAKYSNATALRLNFSLKDNYLFVAIEDDGFGFDINTIKPGSGLQNMRKRAEEINAEFKIQTQPWGGCNISLKVKITQ